MVILSSIALSALSLCLNPTDVVMIETDKSAMSLLMLATSVYAISGYIWILLYVNPGYSKSGFYLLVHRLLRQYQKAAHHYHTTHQCSCAAESSTTTSSSGKTNKKDGGVKILNEGKVY